MRKVAGFLLVVIVLGGAGFLAYRIWRGRPQIDRAAQMAPANSFFYGTLFLDPSNDQKRALRDFLAHFPGTGSPEEAADALGQLLEGPLDSIGLDYETDVDPWLGDQVSMFFFPGQDNEPVGALMLASEDDDAAEAAIEKAFRENPPEEATYAVSDGYLIVGDPTAVDAASDGEGASLGGSEGYEAATQDIAEDRVALLYTNLSGLVGLTAPGGALLPNAETLETVGMDLDRPSATVITLQPDALILESSAGAPLAGALGPVVVGDGSSDLLSDLPEDAWLALGISDLGATLDSYLSLAEEAGAPEITAGLEGLLGIDIRTQLLPLLSDGAIFLEGDSLLGSSGAFVVQTSDEDAAREVTSTVADHLASIGGEVEPLEGAGLEGFSLRVGGIPAPFNVLAGERLIVAYGRSVTDELIEPEDLLADNQTYRRAVEDLGTAYTPTLFFDMRTARQILEDAGIAFGGGLDPAYEENVQPWLEPLLHVTIGARQEGERIVQRTAIGLR